MTITFGRALTPITIFPLLACGYPPVGLLAGSLMLMYQEPVHAQVTIPAHCPSGPPPPVPPPCAKDRCPYPQTARVCSVTPSYKPYSARYSSVDGKYLKLETNGIPDHTIGLFPIYGLTSDAACACGRPDALQETKDIKGGYMTYLVPLDPGPFVLYPEGGMMPVTWLNVPEKFGIAINGVPLDPFADEWFNGDCNTGWEKNASQHPDMMTDLDCNMGHIQPDGTYHYHGLPTGLYEKMGGTYPWNSQGLSAPLTAKTVLLGYGFDGFAVYGPTCYTDLLSPVTPRNWWRPKSSWVLRTGTRGAGNPAGVYNGDYDQDYEYVSGKGDLDACNGHTARTPEYPDGVYHYHITEEFSYIPRCHRTTVTIEENPGKEINRERIQNPEGIHRQKRK